MASGLEIRMPFMDWRLVCYTFSLPWQSKLGGGFTKRIQRDSLAGILDDSIRLRRDKIGWNAPAHTWFKGFLKPMVEDILKSGESSPYLSEFIDGYALFQSISEPNYLDGQHLWNSLLPHLWMLSLKTPTWSY